MLHISDAVDLHLRHPRGFSFAPQFARGAVGFFAVGLFVVFFAVVILFPLLVVRYIRILLSSHATTV